MTEYNAINKNTIKKFRGLLNAVAKPVGGYPEFFSEQSKDIRFRRIDHFLRENFVVKNELREIIKEFSTGDERGRAQGFNEIVDLVERWENISKD